MTKREPEVCFTKQHNSLLSLRLDLRTFSVAELTYDVAECCKVDMHTMKRMRQHSKVCT